MALKLAEREYTTDKQQNSKQLQADLQISYKINMHKALVLSVLGLRCFITLEQRNNFRNVCSQQEKKKKKQRGDKSFS